MTLALWPAIDILEGRVVRLLRGARSSATVYETSPEDAARRFEDEGADGIHVVDLDGAFGTGDNGDAVRRVLGAVRVPVEVGGGIRDRETVERRLREGARRVVLGSLPFSNPALFAEICAAHRERLVVALDCVDGRPRVSGWTEEAAGAPLAAGAATQLAALGVRALLVTDVAKDGALLGPNLDLLASVRRVFAGEVLASGGVRGTADLAPIAAALAGGPAGVVLGRAVHDGLVTVRELRTTVGT